LDERHREKLESAAKRLGIAPQQMPRHIAVIMDGNGRWATQRGLPRFEGHRQGGKTVQRIVQYCLDIGIECLTLYSFSMQNWKRPKEEVAFLMHLYTEYLVKIRPMLMDNNVRLVHLGVEWQLPEEVVAALRETIALTTKNTGMTLALALNYGSRTEIVEAAKKIAREYKSGALDLDKLDEQCFSDHLDTAGLVDPDLVVRTSSEMRISNFLLWQISYAEFYVTQTLWPDFDKPDVDKAVLAFAARQRRFGDVQPAGK
jgi:undecaprenyl diphosphate synthase